MLLKPETAPLWFQLQDEKGDDKLYLKTFNAYGLVRGYFEKGTEYSAANSVSFNTKNELLSNIYDLQCLFVHPSQVPEKGSVV